MRFFVLTFFLVFTSIGFGQIVASTTNYDFGDIYNGSQSYVDIVFTNKTGKTQYLLTIDKPQDVYYIFSGKKMLPDSSIVIRMKVNDGIKGRFNYQVDIYFSDSNTSTPIYLNGTIKEVTSNPLTDCPEFNNNPTNNPLEFTVIIKVIDSLTRLPISNSKVYLVERGELVGEFNTNQKGIIQRSIPLGLYYITAEKESYFPNFFEGYINATRNYVEIELSQPDETVITPDPIPVFTEPEIDTTEVVFVPVVDTTTIVFEPEVDTVVEITEPTIIPDLAEIPDTILNPDYFKFNNITFILDASSSMNASGKMDLLKMSMIELVKILRPEDNITVLKYAAVAEVILEHTSGGKKEEIIAVIKGIKTSGSTAGGDAIKTAYGLNQEKYLAQNNNLVIMITDGLFNTGSTDYSATIENNYKKYGTRFTVVGIKTIDYVREHMQKIVKLADGDFIQIHTIHDAQTKLINEIRRTSYKG